MSVAEFCIVTVNVEVSASALGIINLKSTSDVFTVKLKLANVPSYILHQKIYKHLMLLNCYVFICNKLIRCASTVVSNAVPFASVIVAPEPSFTNISISA